MAQLFKDYVQIFYRLPCKSSSFTEQLSRIRKNGPLENQQLKEIRSSFPIWDVWSINLLENYFGLQKQSVAKHFWWIPWSFATNWRMKFQAEHRNPPLYTIRAGLRHLHLSMKKSLNWKTYKYPNYFHDSHSVYVQPTCKLRNTLCSAHLNFRSFCKDPS